MMIKSSAHDLSYSYYLTYFIVMKEIEKESRDQLTFSELQTQCYHLCNGGNFQQEQIELFKKIGRSNRFTAIQTYSYGIKAFNILKIKIELEDQKMP